MTAAKPRILVGHRQGPEHKDSVYGKSICILITNQVSSKLITLGWFPWRPIVRCHANGRMDEPEVSVMLSVSVTIVTMP